MRSDEHSSGVRRPRRFWRGAIQIGLGLLAFAIFLWRTDLGAVLAQLGRVDLRWALLALAVFTASKMLHAWRWWVFLGHPEVPIRGLTAVFLMSNMANSLLPLRAGDLLRVEVPNRRFGVPRGTLVSSVFVVESILDLFAFAVLLVAALVLADLPLVLRPLVWLVGGAAVVLMGAMLLLSRGRTALAPWGRRATSRLPQRVRAWIERTAPAFVDGMGSLRTNRDALRVVGVSLAAWLVEVGVYWLMAHAFGLDLGVPQALILMIAANLVVSLPLTPWSFGPYELAVTEALVVMGSARTEAAAFAIGSHLMLQAWIAITGIAAMWSLRLGWRDLLPGRGPSADGSAGG